MLSRVLFEHVDFVLASNSSSSSTCKYAGNAAKLVYPAPIQLLGHLVLTSSPPSVLSAFSLGTYSAAGFLTNLIGFFIPAYFSLKALESPQPQDDIQWLTYWVVFGMFTFLETFSSIVLYYVPWYYTIKTLAIVWLMLPQTQGAKMVYSKVIRPAFLTTQKTVHQANASTPAAPAETH